MTNEADATTKNNEDSKPDPKMEDEATNKEDSKPDPKEEDKPSDKEDSKPDPKKEDEASDKEDSKPDPKEEEPSNKEDSKPDPKKEDEASDKEDSKPDPKMEDEASNKEDSKPDAKKEDEPSDKEDSKPDPKKEDEASDKEDSKPDPKKENEMSDKQDSKSEPKEEKPSDKDDSKPDPKKEGEASNKEDSKPESKKEEEPSDKEDSKPDPKMEDEASNKEDSKPDAEKEDEPSDKEDSKPDPKKEDEASDKEDSKPDPKEKEPSDKEDNKPDPNKNGKDDGKAGKPKFNELDDIKEALDRIGGASEHNKEALDYVKEKLDKEPGHLEKVLPALRNVSKSIPDLMSNDPKKIFVGVIDTIGALAPLAGPEGEIISVVLSFVTPLFGGSSGPSVSEVVKEVIDKALTEYKAEDLRAELEGVATDFRNSAAYLEAIQGKRLTYHEIDQLMTNVPIYQGVHYLGKVSSYIHTESEKKENKHEGDARRVLTFLNLYIQLTLTRQMLLTQMCEIVILSKTAEHTVTGITAQLKAQHGDCEKAVQFLIHPTVTQAFYASMLCAHPDDWPAVRPYYKDINRMHGDGVYHISPREWPHWYISCNPSAVQPWLASEGNNSKTNLTLQRVDPEDNLGYWYISNGGTNFFNESKQFSGKPMEAATHWKIILTKEGKLLVNKEHPCRFVQMEDNWIEDSHFIGKEGNPGKTGFWHVKPAN